MKCHPHVRQKFFTHQFTKSCFLVLLIFGLMGCKTHNQHQADLRQNRLRVEEIAEQMRGISMQLLHPINDDGSINLEDQHEEDIINQLRSAGPNAVPALIRVLNDSDVQMRRNAELGLIALSGGGYGGQSRMDMREAIPALIRATEDKDSDVRAWAAAALGEMPDARDAVPALTKLLDDPQEGPRTDACIALGDIGPAASETLPALRKALNDPSKDVRQFAGRAINEIQR